MSEIKPALVGITIAAVVALNAAAMATQSTVVEIVSQLLALAI